ncbi:hypothetical protein HG536_0A02830 [Torulaspora globosa]|uniref:Autophagy-related protein 16 domain-containing protein n=1 Tax=Torulaspora globosa TaxID=48254 RepID=A0A7G3ZAD0_9SACH|nr:uncharacterized protein HG536_0A02830 [Torulaspora globosa]QLL30466.1 hypothetical protein HG536_0A02830 [Torulaspora globosa]
MDELLIERLQERDETESRFSELFEEVVLSSKGIAKKSSSEDSLRRAVSQLRKELGDKDAEIRKLKEVINVRNKDFEKLNDEIISLTIENNLTNRRFTELEAEHNKLVKRWVAKVQQEVDRLNAGFG